MKKTIHTLSALTIAAALTLFTIACSNEDLFIEQPKASANEAPVYHFNIPANMGNGNETRGVTLGESTVTSTFETTDEIFVYNVTKNAWAKVGGNFYDKFASLQPSTLENEGKSCTLTGDLSFYTFDPLNPGWTAVAIDATDTYNLYYKAAANDDYGCLSYVGFTYDEQNGTKATNNNDGNGNVDYGTAHYDYALAEGVTMSLSGSTLTLDGSISFARYGSLFRQRLSSFTKAGNPVSPAPTSFRSLTISSEHEILVNANYFWDFYGNGGITKKDNLIIKSATSVTDANNDMYFALAFDNTALQAGDKLYFEVEGYDGNHYRGEKTIPAGGLQDGKYYYGDLDMVWTSQRAIPTVTASDASPILPTKYDSFEFGDGATISGNSDGFNFYMTGGGSVTLTGNGTASADAMTFNSYMFSCEYNQSMTIILGSDYAFIHRPNEDTAIGTNGSGNLYLKTTGGSHTLTITVKEQSFGGLYGYNHNGSQPVSDLAADANTTVVLTSDTDNGDGTHTYVYTVTTTNP